MTVEPVDGECPVAYLARLKRSNAASVTGYLGQEGRHCCPTIGLLSE